MHVQSNCATADHALDMAISEVFYIWFYQGRSHDSLSGQVEFVPL